VPACGKAIIYFGLHVTKFKHYQNDKQPYFTGSSLFFSAQSVLPRLEADPMLTLRLSGESAMNVISFCSSGLIVTVISGLANPTAAATSWPSDGVGSAASGLLSRSCLEEKN
jgi:hypothetical protein